MIAARRFSAVTHGLGNSFRISFRNYAVKRAICIALIMCLLPMMLSCGGVVKPTDKGGQPRLVRITQKRLLGGICAGFAYWLGWPTWVVRVLTVIVTLATGFAILVYVVLWIFMPSASELPPNYEDRTS
jgi:phage shock protein PspC (stress-responsive transcriptional regulator)